VQYALFVGEEKTLLFRKGQGIVLNEPSVIARKGNKIVALGKDIHKHIEDSNIHFTPVIEKFCIKNVRDATAYFKSIVQKVGSIGEVLVCIPSSIGVRELDDYKTALFTAGVGNIAFVPAVVANAFAFGYELNSHGEFLSTVSEGDTADMAVILGGEIVDGGTLDDVKLFAEAKQNLLNAHENMVECNGDRISVINGAGVLLNDDGLIKKIVALN